jgi:hypothetical protein
MTGARQRHGCLTAWLVLMIVANSATSLLYLFRSDVIRRNLPNAPAWIFPVLIVAALFNLACAVALFQWKKWGFWGFCASSLVALVVNISSGLGIGTALFGLIGVAILYAVLNIGGENKGWPQLE